MWRAFFSSSKCIIAIVIFLLIQGRAQNKVTEKEEVEVQVRWLKDTILVGEPVLLNVIVKRPEPLLLSLKDEDAFFKPFLNRKNLYYKFSERVEENYVRDSILYTLVTFEVDSIQSISLVYEYTWKGKLIRKQSEPVFIYIKSILQPNQLDGEVKKDPTLITLSLQKPANLLKWIGFFLVIGLSFFSAFYLFKYFHKQLKILQVKKEFREHALRIRYLTQKEKLTCEGILEINTIWQKWLYFLFDNRNPASMTSQELKYYFAHLTFASSKSQILYEFKLLEEQIFYANKQISRENFSNKIPVLMQLLEMGLNHKINSIKKSR
ncbi:MAG: hypothetical protein RML72_11925 [Bacteroidia bacterium]|nr:hypothetical protein [Bacteroidia bacterium]MDW8159566.1 hypothetical protein [Bacteroidia bacterium]